MRWGRRLAGLAAASTLLVGTTAFAQRPASVQPTAPTHASQTGPRLSGGVGGIVGFRVEGPNETGDGGLGLYVRGGVQLSELFGVENDLSAVAGLIPLAGPTLLVRDSIDLTVTPVEWLTLAAGPAYSWGISESASVVGGTLRVDFHFPGQRGPTDTPRAWTLTLAGDLGAVVERTGAGRGVAWGAFLGFGYAWY